MGLRLGGDGLYNPAEKYTPSSLHAILIFLDAANRVVPEMLDALREDVFSEFNEAAERKTVARYWADPDHGSYASVPHLPDKVRRKLEAWADYYHMRESWFLDNALRLMFTWKDEPESLERRTLISRTFAELCHIAAWWLEQQAKQPPPALSLPGWNLHVSWTRYETEALEELQRQLRAYRDERLKRASGWKGMEQKYGEHDTRHFEWLALWQCGGCGWSEIAAKSFTTPATVRSEVKRTAALLGFTLRKGKPGRPPKGQRRKHC